jgi:hypothetical protein
VQRLCPGGHEIDRRLEQQVLRRGRRKRRRWLRQHHPGNLAGAGIGAQFGAERGDQRIGLRPRLWHRIGAQPARHQRRLLHVGILIGARHARLAIGDPRIEKADRLAHVNPGEQMRIVGAIGRAIGQYAAHMLVHRLTLSIAASASARSA